jgi:hypothetical protein
LWKGALFTLLLGAASFGAAACGGSEPASTGGASSGGGSGSGSGSGSGGGSGSGSGSGGGSGSAQAMRCMCYTPEPSDYPQNHGGGQKYYDSDFANDDFQALWGAYTDPQSGKDIGRHDLAHLAADLGIDFVRLYDWNSARNHVPFLDECHARGIRVAIPISNYFVGLVEQNDPKVADYIAAIVKEIYAGGKKPHPAAVMWAIGNEYDLGNGISADSTAGAAKILVQVEDELGVAPADRLPITAPVSFAVKPPSPDPGISAVQGLRDAFAAKGLADLFAARFVAAINIYNPGPDIETYVLQTFPKDFDMKPMPLFFSEIGQNSDPSNGGEAGQASFLAGQLAVTVPLADDPAKSLNGYFRGACVFQFLDQTAKSGTEAEYGIQKFGAVAGMAMTKGGQSYPIDVLVPKAAYASVQSAYKK